MMKIDSFENLDAYLDEQMKRLNIPGAALAVVEGDQVVHQRGFGKTGPGGAPPTPQTPFFTGSLTKSFTALALMQLVGEGKMKLDNPVNCYLPWFTLADPQAANQVTVRHLLNQNSGLSTWSGWIRLDHGDDRTGVASRLTKEISTIRLKHPVGAVFEYSNLNYVLLGMIIEAVSGENYAEYVQVHIFNPLGMQHTYTREDEAQLAGLAVGYRYWFWQPLAADNLQEPRSSLPGGGLISCVEDMARYLTAQLNGGRCGGAQVLAPAGVDEMHTPATPIKIMDWAVHYGGIRFASIAPWAMRALLLIPLLQILDVVAERRKMRRWDRHPQSRPSRERIVRQHLLIPLIPSIGLAAVPVFLQMKKRLGFYLDYFPDLAWIAILGGAFAGMWACLRTVLFMRELRKPRS